MTLQAQVQQVYSKIALNPANNAPFAVGQKLAQELGYPVKQIPTVALEAFCGLAYLPGYAQIGPQDRVLDLGCGSGSDTVLAAGQSTQVTAVDFSKDMLQRAHQAIKQAELSQHVTFIQSEAQNLPLAQASMDVVLVNGLFNLNPQRHELFTQLARVTRPAATVYAAELTLSRPLTSSDSIDWFR